MSTDRKKIIYEMMSNIILNKHRFNNDFIYDNIVIFKEKKDNYYRFFSPSLSNRKFGCAILGSIGCHWIKNSELKLTYKYNIMNILITNFNGLTNPPYFDINSSSRSIENWINSVFDVLYMLPKNLEDLELSVEQDCIIGKSANYFEWDDTNSDLST